MNIDTYAQSRLNISLRLRAMLALVLALTPLAAIIPPSASAQEVGQEETQIIDAASAAAALFFSDGSGDFFGRAVASGDVDGDGLTDLLVGAPYSGDGAGRVTLYLGGENGFAAPENLSEAWSYTGESAGDNLGIAMSVGDLDLDGYDDLVIGATEYDDARGRAYLFLGGPQGPAAEPDWTYTGTEPDLYLGVAAMIGDIDGDGLPDLLVGGSGIDARLLVWQGTGDLPAAEPDQEREDQGVNLDLGDFNGDGILDAFVGGYGNDNAGVLSIYRGVQDNGLSLRPAWIVHGEAEFNLLGFGLTNAGDINGDGLDDAVVGAPFNGEDVRGRVYLFPGDSRRVRGPLNLEAATLAWSYSGTQSLGYLGGSVTTVGDLNQDGYADVLVGEPGAETDTGYAHIFLGGPDGLAGAPAWTIRGEREGDGFGGFVTTLGDIDADGYIDFAVGAPGEFIADEGGSAYPGKLYVFHGGPEFGQALGPDIPEPQTDLTWFPSLERAIEGDEGLAFGWPALIIGDVNGDGYDDLAVNSLGNPSTQAGGQVAVYYGEARGMADSPNWVVEGDDWNAVLDTSEIVYGGLALGPVGDVNGDGYDDLLVSAIDWTEPKGDTALVYYGGPEGLGSEPDIIPSPIEPVEEADSYIFGATAGPAGDVNGDGYADAVIAAFEESDDSWSLFLYAGGEAGLSTEPEWSLRVGGISDQSLAFAAAGDTNDDGYADLLVAAPPREGDGPDLPAQAFLYLGGADGLTDEPVWTLDTAPAEDDIPTSIAALGDVNGDGFDDMAVAAPLEPDNGGDMVGRVLILFGDGENVDNGSPQSLTLDLGEDTGFGAVVDGIGDVNGDGYADLLVGSLDFAEDNTIIWQILPGGSQGIGETPLWQVSLLFDEPLLLSAPYYIAGDLNGDGYADVPLSDIDVGSVIDGETSTGQAIVYFGGPGMGSQEEPPVIEPVEPQDIPEIGEWEPSAEHVISGEAGEAFGWPAVVAGDLNGDGYDDVAVASFGNPEEDIQGRVAVYYGSADGIADTADWEATGASWGEFLGTDETLSAFALGPVGDVNGDGYDDLLVTAVGFDGGIATILVYFGSGEDEGGLSQEPVRLRAPYDDNFLFGLRLAPAGDVNGDGYADVALLSYDLEEGEVVIWVYHGEENGLGLDPVWTAGDIDFLESSPSFSAAGDIDGDGFDDLIVAFADEGEDVRTVRLFLGSAEGLATTPAWTWTDDVFTLDSSVSVAGLGDVNGDGYADVAVGVSNSTAPDGAGSADNAVGSGHVLVLFGDGESLDVDRSRVVRPALGEDESFGLLVGPSGDVNGDGYADLLAASISGEGQLLWYLLPAGEQGIGQEPLLIRATTALDQEFTMFHTISGGDVNGDGFADFVLSDVDIARIIEEGLSVGQATLYYGAGTSTDASAAEDVPESVTVTEEITGTKEVTTTEEVTGTEEVIVEEPNIQEDAPVSASISAADLVIVDETELAVEDTRFLTLSPDSSRLLAERPTDRALCTYTTVPPAEEFCVVYRDSMRSVMTSYLAWSPDGRYIAFTEDYYLRLDESDVWLLDSEERSLENLTDDGIDGRNMIELSDGEIPFDVLPVFAPDGESILFERSIRSANEWAGSYLYSMNLADGTLTEVAQLSEGEQTILLSLDYDTTGDIVYSVYTGQTDANNGIWLLPAEESEPRLILAPDEERGVPQAMRVTSGKAIIWYGQYAGRFQTPELPTFEVLDLATGVTQPIELSPGDGVRGLTNAALSPDGTKVLFTYLSAEDTWRLVVRDLDGGAETLLLENDDVLGWARAGRSGLDWAAGDRIFVAGYDVDRLIELGAR